LKEALPPVDVRRTAAPKVSMPALKKLIALAVLGSLTVQEARWATDLAEGPLLLVLIALYALTPVVIVGHVIRRPGVDREAFFGGVAAYLLIGMTYAFTYVALGEFPGSQPFFGAEGEAGHFLKDRLGRDHLVGEQGLDRHHDA